ncbi:MAG: SGNH hydrolase domain-containing protein [Thiolinea sp.]
MSRIFSLRMITFYLLASLSLLTTTLHADETRDALLRAADNEAGGAYVRERYLKLVKVPFDKADERKKALIIGDSHGQDFLNALVENKGLPNYQIRTRYIPNICQMYLGDEDISGFIEPRNMQLCNEADNLQQAEAQIAEADLVILVASWKAWSAERLPQTIQNLQLKPGQTLRVIGRKSFGKINVRSYLKLPVEELKALRNKVDAHQTGVNETMKKSLDAGVFVDVQQIVCGEATTCPVFTPEARLISFDGGHLTQDGARFVGKLLLQSPLLQDL